MPRWMFCEAVAKSVWRRVISRAAVAKSATQLLCFRPGPVEQFREPTPRLLEGAQPLCQDVALGATVLSQVPGGLLELADRSGKLFGYIAQFGQRPAQVIDHLGHLRVEYMEHLSDFLGRQRSEFRDLVPQILGESAEVRCELFERAD